ncbi:ABC transporter permease [Luteimonas deserti]|uniref:ABC transporter permease n=1 Tax=Luteimonas deserti TaxID=2752306 RepID=A0A7Z0QNI0_9GAMM|nr:ABC transporter permease [Luteimonas deserti]NYZ61783.1 ABC transporter permease [Luteimonas deserti]
MTTVDVTTPPPSRAPHWRSLAIELRCEAMRLLREPMYIIPTLLFPALFYAMFGLLMGGRGGGEAARYLLATYGVFGALGAGLFGFAVTVAIDRERGYLALRRALPARTSGWIVPRLLIAMAFSLVIALELALLGSVFGGVSLAPGQWALLWTVTALGALPFCAIGLWLGLVCSANGAPAVVNVVFLPMAFLSGLWLPLSMLPAWLAQLAPLWPAYHLAQVALQVVGQGGAGSMWGHAGVLLGVGVAFSVLAQRRFARVG